MPTTRERVTPAQNIYPQCDKHDFGKSNKIDCHKSTTFVQVADSRNDGVDCYENPSGFSRDDGNHCHTEGVARSISKLQNVSRDISGFTLNMTKNSNPTKFHRHCKQLDSAKMRNLIACNDIENSHNDSNNRLSRTTSCASNDGNVNSHDDKIFFSIADSQTSYSPSISTSELRWRVSLDSAAIMGKDSASVIASGFEKSAW